MEEKWRIWRRIITASILLFCVIISFAVFMLLNRNLTVSRNAGYVEDAAKQTAKRIEDLLIAAENSICTIANLYGQTMDPDCIDTQLLQKMVDDTPFDYIGVVSTDGIYTDNRGLQAQVSDRQYFQDGMAGHSGMDIIFNGRLAHENLMIFYAPLWKNGEIAGVLTGRYGENQMRQIIAATYFGEPAMTYLCLPDGTVFSDSAESEHRDNILTALREEDGSDKKTLETLENALENGHSKSLIYKSEQGSNAAYVTKLPGKDWMLLQVFPIKVTNAMLREFNSIAVNLELWLVLIFAIYVATLLLEYRKQRAKLVMEKRQMRDIVDSASQLFNRFVVVDLKNDTYEYLKSDYKGHSQLDEQQMGEKLPRKGAYSWLRDYWDSRVLAEDESVRSQLTIQSIQKNLTEDTSFLQYEYRIQEDMIRWTQVSVLCLKREAGVPVSVLMTVQDVTELKEAELKNRLAMEEAYRTAKTANEVKNMFLSNMSHDMRTPMNAIIGFSTLLKQEASQPDKVREYGGKIAASGQQLLGIINDVLDMSKIESSQTSLNIVEFEMRELLEALGGAIRLQTQQKRQSLDIQACGLESVCFLGDKERLHQILLNLLSNAVKFTPQGGQVALTVHSLPEISQGFAHLCFQVRDNGIGISEAFLPHVFEPFAREKNTTDSGVLGTGLGLAIVKILVDLMGGTICAESTPGQGSTFRVELELRYAFRQPGKEIPAAQADERKLHGLRVLAAEDNDINAEILEELLLCEGVTCERVLNGQAAVERFRQMPPGYYDAVLMDIQMPVMNGYEAARAIRSLDRPDGKNVPIVAMTANAFAEDVRNSREAGMNAHLAKPIDIKALMKALEELLPNPGQRPGNPSGPEER